MREGALRGIAGRSYELPPGTKRLRLTLGASTVGVLSDGDAVVSVHWSGGRAHDETAETTATRLTLLHYREAEDRYTIQVLPARDVTTLKHDAAYETVQERSGLLRLPVQPRIDESGRPGTLHVRGAAVHEVRLLGADGRLASGLDVPVRGAGTLLVRHGPGLVMAWLDHPGREAQALWGPALLQAAAEVQAPALVPLQGQVQVLRLRMDRPAMLHVRAGLPAVTLLRRGEEAPAVEVHPGVCRLDAYVPAGTVEVALRALGGGTLHGTAELSVTEVTPIGEGLGPEVLLPAGGTRLYSFEVKQRGPVGLGVRADAGGIGCTLLDVAGKRLGSGVVQMPTLQPGTYLMSLHVPGDAQPVRARPALAGLTPPGLGPPQDVIRQYLEAAGILEASEAAAPATQDEVGGEP
jgi:hypothetical protein